MPANNKENELLPLSSFTNIGQCSLCKSPIDKMDGCTAITCPVRKAGTKFIEQTGK